jgi:hypothetical protein
VLASSVRELNPLCIDLNPTRIFVHQSKKLIREPEGKAALEGIVSELSSSEEADEEIRDRARDYYQKLLRRRERNRSIREEESKTREPTTMNRNLQTQPQASGERLARDTGFPEPFNNERNTTLPHPDADTGPNPVIEAPDFNLSRTHSRRSIGPKQYHTFRNPLGSSRRSSRLSPGALTGDGLAGLYDNIEYEGGTRETRSKSEIERDVESREGLVSQDLKRERKPNDSGIDMNINGNGFGERKIEHAGFKIAEKKGVLKKFGLKK